MCTDCGRYCCDCCYTSAEMERMGFFWKPPVIEEDEFFEEDELDETDLMLLQFPEFWYTDFRKRTLQHALMVGCNCSATEICSDCK